MKARSLLQVLLLAAFIAFSHHALGQQNVVGFPRDQIALQLGALQMGYVQFGTSATPFNPTNKQEAANALAQGRIALARTNGWGTNNVLNAVQPTNYGEQLDLAVQAVMAFAATNKISGTVTLGNGRKLAIAARMTVPPLSWSVPLPYAISAATAGPQGPAGPAGAPGTNGLAATIAIGNVTTGDPGTQAVVTNEGTSEAAVFSFSIPRGGQG
jgi:hypothetical protein